MALSLTNLVLFWMLLHLKRKLRDFRSRFSTRTPVSWLRIFYSFTIVEKPRVTQHGLTSEKKPNYTKKTRPAHGSPRSILNSCQTKPVVTTSVLRMIKKSRPVINASLRQYYSWHRALSRDLLARTAGANWVIQNLCQEVKLSTCLTRKVSCQLHMVRAVQT